MVELLGALGATTPVIAAPMSGGPTTPALVIGANRAGSFGFLAGGYKTAEALSSQIREVRAAATSFGVNLFAPNPLPVDPDRYRSYAAALNRDAERYGLDLTASSPREDDDDWANKIDLLVRDPVPVVSFTFGIPGREIVEALQRGGSIVVQTVTSPAEATAAADAGVDVLAVQSHEAGGHFATLTPVKPSGPVPIDALVASVRAAVTLPVIAAGGLGSADAVKKALAAGADAAMVGTYLLLTPESGASPTYKSALAIRRDVPTAVTIAFSGRPARGIRNRFMDSYEAAAPFGYPAVHHLTSPLRKAAAADGEPELINLWAGTGHASCSDQPVAAALAELSDWL